eukprot:14454780-Alexandrium_andersonii.AAC.1
MPRDPCRSRPRQRETMLCGGRAGARTRRSEGAEAPMVRVSALVSRARERWACTRRPLRPRRK